MHINNSSQVSTLNRALGVTLAAFSMFVVGYTASRVVLTQAGEAAVTESNIVPHQATMWSDLGR